MREHGGRATVIRRRPPLLPIGIVDTGPLPPTGGMLVAGGSTVVGLTISPTVNVVDRFGAVDLRAIAGTRVPTPKTEL